MKEIIRVNPELDLCPTVFRAIPVKIFYLHYRRNAWHSTRIARYYKNLSTSLFAFLEEAKEYAENVRVEGSVFYISEIPGIVYESYNYSLLVTEINSNNPLRFTSKKIWPNMFEIFEYFKPVYKNTILRLELDVEEKFKLVKTNRITSHTRLKTYMSSSTGRKYFIKWNLIKENSPSKIGVINGAQKFNKSLSDIPFWGWKCELQSNGIKINPFEYGPTEKIGLSKNDVITLIQQKNNPVTEPHDILNIINTSLRISEVVLTVEKNNKKKKIIKYVPPSIKQFRTSINYFDFCKNLDNQKKLREKKEEKRARRAVKEALNIDI